MLAPKIAQNRTNSLTGVTRLVLWARAAGRCEYEGCNKSLIGDLVSGTEDKNYGFVAHIVADRPTGPRGDRVRSRNLSDKVENLMLLCHVHHKLIDVDDVAGHPEERLLRMKADHERRVETVTAIDRDRASHVLRFAAGIGAHESPIAYEDVAAAMLPEWFPAEGRNTIDIEMRGSARQDHEPEYWAEQRAALRRSFGLKVKERIESRDLRHLSVFGLAPQPLLIELGRLLCDIVPASIHQLAREPKGWKWREAGLRIEFRIRRPEGIIEPGTPAALVLALSADVVNDRITSILPNAAVWSISAAQPGNDIMRYSDDLAEFRRLVRMALNEIKARHGETATIHVFPVLPVSAAIEVGRVWMPKADLPLAVYDQNRKVNGFIRALDIQ